jgi:TolB-like protein/DNA-binding winged helix-turn-helix (wHTH) protein/tetratricopeptide (TPR) repeat protein
MTYLFEDCSLDTERRELRRGTDLIGVEPQVFDLLLFLVRNRTRVVSKDDLIAEVWNGRIVSESALYSRITAARQAIGDSGETQRLIRTVARKGLRFVADVRETHSSERTPLVGRSPAPHPIRPVTAAPTQDWPTIRRNGGPPAVVVMPFDNLNMPSDGYLVDGLVDEITSALSRVRDFCVIARQSAFAYKGRLVDAREVHKDLGASYVVEGTVRRDGDHLRISVKLVDAETCNQLWSERYDGVVSNIFEFQDHIAAQVAGTLQPAVRNRQLDAGARKPPNSLAAYDCVLRGIALHKHGHATAEEAKEAVAWFDRALELDPHYARALAWRACAAAHLWPPQPTQEHLDRNMHLVSRALSIDPADSEAHRIKGALHTFQRQFDLAAYHLERARDLNPNDAHILVKGGLYLSYLGEHEEGLNDIDLAMQRNPLHPDWYWRERGIVLFGLGAYREALNALERCQEDRDLDHIYQAACLVALGDDSPAHDRVEQLRRTRPEIDLHWVGKALLYRCYKNAADLSRLTAFLGTAGMT